MRQAGVDEHAIECKVHIHQDAMPVDPAGVRRRLLSLPREICAVVSNLGLRKLRGDPIAAQKSAAGKVAAVEAGSGSGETRTVLEVSCCEGPNGARLDHHAG
jgi:hypothetical protein